MIIEQWARNVVETRFEDLDADVVEQAKKRIIDVVGCMVGGANGPGNSMIIDMIMEWDGKKEATVLAHGVKAPAHDVAMINAMMARSYDFGALVPYIDNRPVFAHISESTVPTAVTVTEWQHLGGKELITALVLGDDIVARLSDAGKYFTTSGWESPGTVNKFGSAAIAGKLMGLNESQIRNAFGIVLDQLAGSFQNYEDIVHSFKMPQGLGARDGIVAARLASRGWTGVKDPITSKFGYFALYCKDYDPEILTKDLGKKFYADQTFKPYPCCGGTHSSIDCALSIVREHDVKADDIDEITLNVREAYRDCNLGYPFVIGDVPQANAAFSLRYCVANALLRKCVKLEHYTEEFIRDPKIGDLTKKINITGTMSPDKPWGAELTVKTKDGREFYAHEDVPKGNPTEKPLTKEEIEDKFRANVAFSKKVTDRNAEAALDMLNKLEDTDDITKLIQLLVG